MVGASHHKTQIISSASAKISLNELVHNISYPNVFWSAWNTGVRKLLWPSFKSTPDKPKYLLWVCECRASGIGAAAPVLAGAVFRKVKVKYYFYKKQVIYKNACMIFGLVRLIILSYNRWKKHIKRCRLSVANAFNLLLCL